MILSIFALAVGAAIALIGGLGAGVTAETAYAPDAPRSAGYV